MKPPTGARVDSRRRALVGHGHAERQSPNPTLEADKKLPEARSDSERASALGETSPTSSWTAGASSMTPADSPATTSTSPSGRALVTTMSGPASATRLPPLVIGRGNCAELASVLEGPGDLPDGTLFESLAVLSDFASAWRARSGHVPFFSWEGTEFPKRFPIDGPIKDREERAGLQVDDETGRHVVFGSAQEIAASRQQLIRRSFEEIVDVSWRNVLDITGLGYDALVCGAFAKKSVFAMLSQYNMPTPGPAVMEAGIKDDPCLIWNPNGSLTFLREGRRAAMLRCLEQHLCGKPLSLYRAQHPNEDLLLELLRNLDSRTARPIREQIVAEYRQLGATDPAPATAAETLLAQQLESPSLSDREFASILLARHPPFFFTAMRPEPTRSFGPTTFEYQIDLAKLPARYKDRIYIAPDGLDRDLYAEFDLPMANLEDAVILANALKKQRSFSLW